ncbi:protein MICRORCHIDIA 7-like [Cucumis melo var. makuwa]|uniref:Protein MICRORCHIDIA 7-like n=1 Tax=Cucumis melo var. makuwa TaxID=1194695 RepID=A0A5D3E1L0_CUCMM|nr:protein MICRORCHIDIA 7-like [Cucumis melo var. makuwa]
MASSLIDNRNSADAIDDVSGAQTLSTVINASANTADAGSGSCLVISDDSDDSFSHSVNVPNLKRKYVSESGNCSSSEEDDSVSILKSPKLSSIPLLVQPIRSVKASEYETPVSPSSVKVENLSSFEVVPYKMEDLEDESKDNLPNKSCRQFWKAGDYEGNCNCDPISSSVGMDHVRVHPKFLHSNATSHKWALGAFAELLDNSLDEVCNGATYVNIDMLINERDGNNGGGMCPDKIRRCMSLGYSSKRNMPNTIGQYGNGFKTSTMRLGADVIVFSRCSGSDQRGPTQSIGMLSYTFLRDTGKEDIVVPMVDFEFKDDCWSKMMRSEDDWNKNLKIIAQWSPYSIEELFKQDIQIRGVNRDEKNVKMAQQYPNSRHYLTYRHSLRMCVKVTIGFVKDARSHIDVQGFNVYHKNRLIKPFWRIWNPAGSDGRGVVGVLEANFVEPAHDKQGFERTIVLSRLESRLIQIQKDYWTKNCQVVGYAPRRRLVESNNNMDKMNGGANVGSGINLSSSTSSTTPPPPTSSTVLPTTTTTTKPNVIFEKLVLPNVKVTAQPGMTPGSTMYTYTSHQSSPPSTGMANPVIRQPRPSVQSPTVNSNGMLFGNAGITSSLKRGKEELIDLLRPERLKDPYVSSLMTYFSNEMDKNRCLESTVATLKNQLHEATQKLEEKEKERMLQIDFSSAEIMKKDKEIATLTERLWNATASINELRGRISELENSNNVTL